MSEVQTNIGVTDDGTLVVRRSQDVDPILRQAHDLARFNGGKSQSGEMYHAARLPMVIIEQYCNANKITFQQWMQNPEHARRMLNDPALAKFRVWEGRA